MLGDPVCEGGADVDNVSASISENFRRVLWQI
jgi:hypothetical protein